MAKVCRMIEKVALTNASALLLGDSGTGKELLARAVHALSPRSGNKFVAINCAAIPDTLLESELFGYEKGAFTGALKQTQGKFELADGGTLFLDEIGDMPVALQAKLLRFLQDRFVERIGGRSASRSTCAWCARRTRTPLTLVQSGGFREDLFYRISEVTVRSRRCARAGDAIVIAQSVRNGAHASTGAPCAGSPPEALQGIQGYAWPGNIRELENRVNNAVIMAEGKYTGSATCNSRTRHRRGRLAQPACGKTTRRIRRSDRHWPCRMATCRGQRSCWASRGRRCTTCSRRIPSTWPTGPPKDDEDPHDGTEPVRRRCSRRTPHAGRAPDDPRRRTFVLCPGGVRPERREVARARGAKRDERRLPRRHDRPAELPV
jgi:transcriptional regulator with GAF, ATPase, and Fis domain